MPFGLKNAISTFSRTMVEIFKEWTDQFLKILVMMSTSTIVIGMNTWNTSSWFLTC
jgi:hypothetical protein